MLYLGLSCVLLYVSVVFATELTFELPDNEKQCFYEELEKDVKFDIDFQVSYFGDTVFSLQAFCSITNLLFMVHGSQEEHT